LSSCIFIFQVIAFLVPSTRSIASGLAVILHLEAAFV
jgi:hypothetical protein